MTDQLNYNDLMKMVEQKNKIEGEKCLICHFPDTKENLLKLSCSHYFHKKCLILDENKLKNYNSKSFRIICPYCSKKSTYKMTSKKSKESKKSEKSNDKSNENLQIDQKCCQAVLKTGINKGKICGRISCMYHKSNHQ
tara:strand:- start:2709 stop:3122 length:414 start_codon:yes stop_codon:yes gene_type:complete